MFAVVEFRNNQYKIHEGEIVSLPSFSYDEKDKQFVFDKVLLIGGNGQDSIGIPAIHNASVSAEIIKNYKTKKVRVFKFRAKKRYKKTSGQRQDMVLIKINKINLK